jgi:hypothetical protein
MKGPPGRVDVVASARPVFPSGQCGERGNIPLSDRDRAGASRTVFNTSLTAIETTKSVSEDYP